MKELPLVTSSTSIAVENFWTAIFIYHNRPHLINKKVVAVSQGQLFYKIALNNNDEKPLSELFTRESILYEVRKTSELTAQFLRNILDVHAKDLVLQEANQEDFNSTHEDLFVSVRFLIGRVKNSKKVIEVITFDKKHRRVSFHAVQERDEIQIAPPFPYHIQLNSTDNLIIAVDSFGNADTASADWLADRLFSKLIKWTEIQNGKSNITSLSLIDADKYCLLYNQLKEQYAPDLIKVWPDKTKTNPEKYIFEDLGIAAYLICLWEKLEAKNVNFVDCGCGNGLLVYILIKFGYKGCGIDVRSRKIWDYYKGIDLKVGTVSPSSLYSEATWLIGNHSDELTPWIPVIAMKSSANFFLLPCCSFDFSGKKYKRTNTKVSQYEDYLNYVRNISERCGFHTDVDKLRIPSTKRTCFVGIRNNVEVDFSEIDEFIKSQSNDEFASRNPVEITRNCTQLDKSLIGRIVRNVVAQLLTEENFENSWNKGGTFAISDVIKKIPTDDLKELRNNCGGLQTLLKNHRYIFCVRSGQVSLQIPPKMEETNKYKEKPCWFQLNHPNGCLYSADVCGYKHTNK